MSLNVGKVSREIRGHLLLIGLDRATKRNAFDSHLIHDLSQALTEYEDRIVVKKVDLRRDDAFNKLIIDIVFTYKDISQAELYGESLVSLAVKV